MDGVGEVYGLVDGCELMEVDREPWTGEPIARLPVNHIVLYDCDEYGSSTTVCLSHDPAVAHSFIGRAVRVRVEVLDG